MTEEERKERKRERKKAYYLAHREEILSYRKEYYKENREKLLLQQREYKSAHYEELLLYRREYCKENRDKILLYKKEYHKKNRENERKYTLDIRNKALDLYGHKCELCGAINHLEFHHLNLDGVEERKVYSSKKLNKSLADGNKRSDLQLLCRSCHHKIHNDLRSSI